MFVTGMFVGGAAGLAGATLAWTVGGWGAVCGFGGLLAAALGTQMLWGRGRAG